MSGRFITLEGGEGDDHLSGQTSDDSLVGAAGADTLLGGRGNDTLIGGVGEDSLEGGLGDDVFVGVEDGSDDETIAASDVLDADTMRGGDGNDTFVLGSGDVAEGGAGVDTFASGTWVDADNLPVIEDFDVAEDVFALLVPEGEGTGTVTVDADADAGEGWFTVSYDGAPVATVFGAGMTPANVSVVETDVVESAVTTDPVPAYAEPTV